MASPIFPVCSSILAPALVLSRIFLIAPLSRTPSVIASGHCNGNNIIPPGIVLAPACRKLAMICHQDISCSSINLYCPCRINSAHYPNESTRWRLCTWFPHCPCFIEVFLELVAPDIRCPGLSPHQEAMNEV